MSLLVLCAGVGILVATLALLRLRHIRVEYAFSWLIVGVVLSIAALVGRRFPGITVHLGVSVETLWVGLAGALLTAILFEVSAAVSRLRDENVVLAQRLAILEHGFQNQRDASTRKADQAH